MSKLEQLRKVIEEKKGKKKKAEGKPESVDLKKVDKIVSSMKKKYKEEGIEFEEVGGKLRELRDIISEGEGKEVEVQTVQELTGYKSGGVRALGNVYLKLSGLSKGVQKVVEKFPQVRQLSFYLYSANMRFSAKQFLALITAAAMMVFIISLVVLITVFSFIQTDLILKLVFIPLLSFVFAAITVVIGLLIPRRRAHARGNAMSIELPFALRHMATELKAGIGLYRTLQTIAVADYGVLSEEFARTITEVEEGTDTKIALRHFALRCHSKALRNALIHVIRALKTGGNLSEIMGDIAEDVAFELRTKIRDFAEKMNFFAAIYIYLAIVVPVFIAILASIKTLPVAQGTNLLDALPIDITMATLFYLVGMPLVLIYLIVFVSMSQPKV